MFHSNMDRLKGAKVGNIIRHAVSIHQEKIQSHVRPWDTQVMLKTCNAVNPMNNPTATKDGDI